MGVAITRGRAEAEVESDPDFADGSTLAGRVENELCCLIQSLDGLIERHFDKMDTYLSLANKERRGRPTTKPSALQRLMGGHQVKPTRRAGRPLQFAITNDALVADLDRRRQEGASTERAAIQQFVAESLTQQGKHTAGERVERQTRNLQRRVAGLRSGVRKLREK